jgi:hypothetical protein
METEFSLQNVVLKKNGMTDKVQKDNNCMHVQCAYRLYVFATAYMVSLCGLHTTQRSWLVIIANTEPQITEDLIYFSGSLNNDWSINFGTNHFSVILREQAKAMHVFMLLQAFRFNTTL